MDFLVFMLYIKVPITGIYSMFFNNLLCLEGTFASETKLWGFIIIIRSIKVSSFAHVIKTKGEESRETMTSVFSPITFLIKSVSSCTYKKLVYVKIGRSEQPHPSKSIVYTVLFFASFLATFAHSSPDAPESVSCI